MKMEGFPSTWRPPRLDRGRKRLSPSPPSEPCVRFSRTRLSSRWFPHRDWLANVWASLMVKSPISAKKAFVASSDAVASAAHMPSFHTEASTHIHFPARVSAPCLALAGTADASLSLCLSVKLTHPPSCLPSLGAALLSALLAAVHRCGTMKALTPASLHPRCRSPRLLRHTFLSFRLQPRGLPGHRLPPRQRDQRVSDFAMNEQARRSSPPNRVRCPTDQQFALGCSPPRLGADAVSA